MYVYKRDGHIYKCNANGHIYKRNGHIYKWEWSHLLTQGITWWTGDRWQMVTINVNVGALFNALAVAIQQAAGQGNQQAIPSPMAPLHLVVWQWQPQSHLHSSCVYMCIYWKTITAEWAIPFYKCAPLTND